MGTIRELEAQLEEDRRADRDELSRSKCQGVEPDSEEGYCRCIDKPETHTKDGRQQRAQLGPGAQFHARDFEEHTETKIMTSARFVLHTQSNAGDWRYVRIGQYF